MDDVENKESETQVSQEDVPVTFKDLVSIIS